MGRFLKRGYALGLAAALLAGFPAKAQKPQATLVARTADGRTTFHIGERIPLKLTFTSPNDTQYLVAPASNPRGGEFDFEHIDVSPSTGWSDPLATYFAQKFPKTGHGWTWAPLLKAKPVEVSVDLNQWVRFDEPGIYRVKVSSSRVAEKINNGSSQTEVQSNQIELNIVPATPEWQESTLKSILDCWGRNKCLMNGPEENATADLRYLATPAAIEEMTFKIGLGDGQSIAHECSMGLVGLPESMRHGAIASMNKRIDEPDFPVSRLFFSTMELLHVKAGSDSESIRQQRATFESGLWQAVLSAVSTKSPSARAQTVQTLLTVGRSVDRPEVKPQMASLLRGSLLNLDVFSQEDDLREHWDLLRSPEILPALKAIAMLPSDNLGATCPCASQELKSFAFRRWYELDSYGAQKEIFAQIGSSTPSMSGQALHFLPANPMPQFEPLWAEAYLRTTDQLQEIMLGSLLVRFGTGSAKAQMIAKLNEKPRPNTCWSHSFALAYLTRFSPVDARPFLEREIGKEKAQPVCDGDLLRLISENGIDTLMTAPVLNEVAVQALDDSNTANVQDAIQYLTAYGTAQDEKPIWNRYVKWAQDWKGKADFLDLPRPAHPQTQTAFSSEKNWAGRSCGIRAGSPIRL